MSLHTLVDLYKEAGYKAKEAMALAQKELERQAAEEEKKREEAARQREEAAHLRETEKLRLERELEMEKLHLEEAARQREEASRDREMEKLRIEEAARQREEANRQREHELRKLELQSQSPQANASQQPSMGLSQPRLTIPPFDESKDEIDSYIRRFELYVENYSIPEHQKVHRLGVLLTGKALNVYANMPQDDLLNYDLLKEELLKCYAVSMLGYKQRFVSAKPNVDDSAGQFLKKIRNYFDKWVELSPYPQSYNGVVDLMVSEKLIESIPRDAASFVKDSGYSDNEELVAKIDRYLQGRERKLVEKQSQHKQDSQRFKKDIPERKETTTEDRSNVKCYTCHRIGHTSRFCRQYNNDRHKYKNEQRYDFHKRDNKNQVKSACARDDESKEKAASCIVEEESQKHRIIEQIRKDGSLNIKGYDIDVVTACQSHSSTSSDRMPTAQGYVNGRKVTVLRDTGCSGVVVKREFVLPKQITEKSSRMILIDNSFRIAPVARIKISTPFYSGEVDALCLKDALYDLILGNVPGAKLPEDLMVEEKIRIGRNDDKGSCEFGKLANDTTALFIDSTEGGNKGYATKDVVVSSTGLDKAVGTAGVDGVVPSTKESVLASEIIFSVNNQDALEDEKRSNVEDAGDTTSSFITGNMCDNIAMPSVEVNCLKESDALDYMERCSNEHVSWPKTVESEQEGFRNFETHGEENECFGSACVEENRCCVIRYGAQSQEHANSGPNMKLTLDVDKESISKMQHEDNSLLSIRRKILEGDRRYKEENNLLYKVLLEREEEFLKLIVPSPLRKSILCLAHDTPLSGHLGIKRTRERIAKEFYWPGMDEDVTRYCRSCDLCQKIAPKGRVKKTPLCTMPIIEEPFKRVGVDLVGPLLKSSEGYKYILTLVDYATRYPEAVPLRNINAKTVAEALIGIYCRLGVPQEVLSDLGTQFTSEIMREVSELLKIRKIHTSPYHPATNGLCERSHSTLKNMLRKLCHDQPSKWPKYINPLLFAYRETPQASTGFSPFELLYGRTVRGPMQILKELWTGEVKDEEVRNSYRYIFELRERMEETLKIARENLSKSQERYKHYYDRKTQPRIFNVGDKALVLLPTSSNKLLLQWKGPFEITQKRSGNTYKVKIEDKEKLYHANLLKLYVERDKEFPPEEGAQETAAVAVFVESEEESAGDALLPILDFPKGGKENASNIVLDHGLTLEQEDDLKRIVGQFNEIFTDKPGLTSVVEHCIHLTTSDPVRRKPYPVPHSMRESLKKEMEDMLKLGIIRESSAPYASPVVVVKKKDGSNRVCCDFRNLNAITVFDPEPVMTADDLFTKLANNKYFSKFDLSKGYWQVKIREQDIEKTAFVTPDGHFEYLRMAFGLVNAGATLTRAMKMVLKGMEHTDNYIDDVIVHTNDWETHLVELTELFARMKKAGFTLRPSKCVLGSKNIEFLGHKLGAEGITPLSENIEKIKNALPPKTKKDVRSFLGLTGYYRNFINRYAEIAAPLTELTKKGKPMRVRWSESEQRAYEKLKLSLTTQPILQIPDVSKPFVLQVDASADAIGLVLMQEHTEGLFPVAYASKKFSDRERGWSTLEKEGYAIVYGIKKFQKYLYGREFTLYTDHRPLIYMQSAKYSNQKIMRWVLSLQPYSFKVLSIKGKDNVAADLLSRLS